jgi:type IV pilus assembly protein PilC
MSTFKYTATRKDGSHYQGTLEAKDRFALFSALRKDGETLVGYREVHKGASWTDSLTLFGSVRQTEKITFVRNLSSMIEAGLSLSRALSVLERQTQNKKLKSILASVSADIEKGSPLNAALGKYPRVFSPLLVSMVRAGEETGGLAQSLSVVGVQMERAHALAKRIKGALIYPAIVVCAMIVIGILMLTFVVPTLSSTFKELNVALPASTRFILAASEFLTHNTLVALLYAGVFIAAIVAAFRTRPGRRAFEFGLLHIPVIGTIVKETNAARTARTLSSLLSAGVSPIFALNITRDVVQNSYYKDVIQEAGIIVEKGRPLSEAFLRHGNIYPIIFSEMIAVGEETGQHSEMLLRVAEFYEGEVEQKTKDISTIIEPFLMLAIGGGVGFFAVAMITPIYSISSGV